MTVETLDAATLAEPARERAGFELCAARAAGVVEAERDRLGHW